MSKERKMTPHTLRHILLTAVLALVGMQHTVAQTWDMDVVADSTLSMDSSWFADSPSQLYRYHFIEAVAQQNRGHHDEAFRLLRQCIELDSNAAEGYYEIAGYYVDRQQPDSARACFERAAALQPKNNTYVERLGQFYINQSEYAKATAVYEQLYTNNRSRADIVETLYRLYYVQEKPEKMLEQLDRMETIEGSSEQIALSRMQIYGQLGKKSRQLDELKSLVSKHPNDPNYRLMMGNWLLKNGRTDEAFDIFKAVLKEEHDNATALLSILDYYRAIGDRTRTDLTISQLLSNPKTEKVIKLALLQQMVQADRRSERDDSVKTLRLIDRVLAEKQEDASIYLFKAAYMSVHQMPDSTINQVLEQALAVEPDNSTARMQLIWNIWKDEDWDRIIALSRPAQEYNPSDMSFYYFEGIAEYQKGDEDAALHTFRKGVSQINQDSNAALASDFYAVMGDILHNKGLDQQAFAAYDSCLVYKSDNISALNNYAYYLCLTDSALDKAERMSRQAIEAEPDNSTYLDTYAWVRFLQGEYADALTHIEKAIAADTTVSGVVKEHAGDIYAMNGNIDKALEYWQMALSFDKDNALLQEKIKQKKYIKQ